MTLILSGSDGVTFPDSTEQETGYANGIGFRNRIINGDMRIDQRNAGAAVTASPGFPVDRFPVTNATDGAYSAQQDTSAPTGFVNSVKVTATTADATLAATQFLLIQQQIEGTNVSDLAWGTANAKTVTLSFWVRSSLTGTFGGAVRNSAQDRSYPFTYSISVADTWEYKTVTIAGDTSGTWLTTTGSGLQICWGLGVGSTFSGTANAWAGSQLFSTTGAVSVIGTLNATWYITGVQLEVGSVATPFERRPYGTELALCQRYYYRINAVNSDSMFGVGFNLSTTAGLIFVSFQTQMRTNPTALEQSGTASDYRIRDPAGNTTLSSVPAFSTATQSTSTVDAIVASGLTAGQGILLRAQNTSAFLAWSAEL